MFIIIQFLNYIVVCFRPFIKCYHSQFKYYISGV